MDEEYRQYWKTVVATMQDGLFVVDPGGIIASSNPAMETLTGYSPEELVGQPCTILGCDLCAGVMHKQGEEHCQLFSEGGIRRCRCTLRHKDGSPVSVLKNASLLKDGTGRVIGGVETLTDLREVVAKENEICILRRELGVADSFQGIIGTSGPMRRLFDLIAAAAESEAPVLIQGESGTGKELIAQAIHDLSARKNGPFIKTNCAALNESLLESELFGHVKGAFTGAERARLGRFEAAGGGDFFLDEVGDLPPSIQVKLLRVLQEKVIERVGDHKPIEVDVRIMAATHQDLMKMVEDGSFRQDLFFRVAVIPIMVPPLRERSQDIPLLAESFISRVRAKSGKNIKGISQGALDALNSYRWPGNVRELINAVEYAFVICKGEEILAEHLPGHITQGAAAPRTSAVRPRRRGKFSGQDRKRILEALEQAGGRKEEAARILGVSRVTLWKWLKAIDQKEAGAPALP